MSSQLQPPYMVDQAAAAAGHSLAAASGACGGQGVPSSDLRSGYRVGNHGNKGSFNVGNINYPFALPTEEHRSTAGVEEASTDIEIDFSGSLNVGNVINPPLPPPSAFGYQHGHHTIGNYNNEISFNVGNIRLPDGIPYTTSSIGNSNNKGSLNVGNIIFTDKKTPHTTNIAGINGSNKNSDNQHGDEEKKQKKSSENNKFFKSCCELIKKANPFQGHEAEEGKKT